MTQANYWTRLTEARFTRRRALVATGASGLAAALLAACGSSGSSGDEKGNQSGLVTVPADTSKKAVRGGVFKDSTKVDIGTFDVHILAENPRRPFVWTRLTKVRSGLLEPATGDIDPDGAESWEFSPDKLQVTFKLRPDSKWDPRPPTNGRDVDAQDVVFSWDRLVRVGGRRADFANSVNPASPILGVTAVDNRTIVMKLAFPDADLLTVLAGTGSGNLHLLPKESDSAYDMRSEAHGSGAYYISEYRPSATAVYKRNPGYYDKNLPYIDTWEAPIITEYATGLSQFKAGSLYRFDVRGDDILPTKRAISDLVMVQTDVAPLAGHTPLAFYGFDDTAKSPFRDERLRQAFSLSLDRDLWIDTFHSVSQLRGEGLPMTTAWNTAVLCNDFGWWLDPQGKDFGPNAKYFSHDIAEAKKLVAAAGFPNGVEIESHYITSTDYGSSHLKMVEVVTAMAADAGLRFKGVPHNYTLEWGPKYRDSKGHFEGVAYSNASGTVDAGVLNSLFNSKGSLFKGFSPDGSSTFAGDPYLDDLTVKIKQEYDRKKRFALAHDLQRYVAKTQYYTRFPGGASGFSLAWPVVGNFGVYSGGTTPEFALWIDSSKAPLKG